MRSVSHDVIQRLEPLNNSFFKDHSHGEGSELENGKWDRNSLSCIRTGVTSAWYLHIHIGVRLKPGISYHSTNMRFVCRISCANYYSWCYCRMSKNQHRSTSLVNRNWIGIHINDNRARHSCSWRPNNRTKILSPRQWGFGIDDMSGSHFQLKCI